MLRWKASRKRALACRPLLTALEDRTLLAPLLATNPFASIAKQLDSDLGSIQTQLETALNAASAIPFLNHDVGNLAPAQFINKLRANIDSQLVSLGNQTSPPTVQDIQQAFFNALGNTGGLNQLVALTANPVGPDDVRVTPTPGGFSVEMRLHGGEQSVTTTGFSTGLPSLPIALGTPKTAALTAKASFSVSVGYDYELAFDYNIAQNATTLDPSVRLTDFGGTGLDNELSVSVDTTLLPNQFSAMATVGFLQGMLAPIAGQDTSFHGHFTWDGLNAATPVGVDGQANVNMRLSGGFGEGVGFPMIGADFHLAWHFDSKNPTGDAPTVRFDNVGLDLGGFLSSILGPIFTGIEDVEKPIKGPIDVISAPLPGISDLSELLNNGPVSLLTLASAAGNSAGYGPLVTLIDTVVQLVSQLEPLIGQVKSAGNITIPLGGFNLSQDDGDLRTAPAAGDVNNMNLASLTKFTLDPSSLSDSQLESFVPKSVATFLDKLINPVGTLRFDFPILDDPAAAVFGLILGKNSDLASFTAQFSFGADSSKAPGLSFAGFGVSVTASAQVDGYFRFAYDTMGLREVIRDLGNGVTDTGKLADDVADGFYIDGKSQLSISGSIGLSAGFQFGFLGFSVDGNIGTGADGRGDDPTQAIKIGLAGGNVRFKNFNSNIFTTHGELAAGLSATLSVGVDFLGTFIGYTHTFDIANEVLVYLDYDANHPPPTPPTNHLGDVTTADFTTSDGTFFPAGTLILDVGGASETGPGADGRRIYDAIGNPITNPNVTSTTSDDYTITHISQQGPTETVEVTDNTLGASETISGVTSIYATPYGGDGADTRTIDVQDGVTSNATLFGGYGHADLTYSGTGTATLTAGGLSSRLVGGAGTNHLNGGNGGDELVGGTGRLNYIHGGTGVNTVEIQAPPDGVTAQDVILAGPGPNNTLLVVPPPKSSRTDVTAEGAYIEISSIPNSNIPSFVIDSAEFANVVIGGNLSYNNVTVGDLSGTSLATIGFDLTNGDFVAGAHSSLTIDGSPGGDNFTASAVTDPATGDNYTLVDLNNGAKDFDLKIDGIRVTSDVLTLDGMGGANHYTVNPAPTDLYTTSIVDSGPTPSDVATVNGYSYSPGNLGVSDSGVTLSYVGRIGNYTYPGTEDINFDSHVGNVTIVAPYGSDTITGSRNIGSTTILSEGPVNTFHISGLSNYTLEGNGPYNDFVIVLPPVVDVLRNTNTNIVDENPGGTGTLVIDDSGSLSIGAPTQYVATAAGLTRTTHVVGGIRAESNRASVTFSAMRSVTIDTGQGTNFIDVEGTAAGAATTLNAATGINDFSVGQTAKDLNLIAGPLTINGAAAGDNSLALYDARRPGRHDQIAVGPGTIGLDSATITYALIASLAIAAPGNDLAITTAGIGNDYFVTSTLEVDPANPLLMTVQDPELPPIVFNDDLNALTIKEGAYGAILDVDQTPSACTTTVDLSFSGVVNVNATAGPLDLVGKIVIPGTVNVGQGSLAPIGGDVTVLDANTGALVTLNVNDSADIRAHRNVTISSTQITGLAGADESTVIGYGGGTLAALNISGSLGTGVARRDIAPTPPGRKPRPTPVAAKGSVYNITGTPSSVVDPVTTLTSNGVDSVNVMMPNSNLGGYGALVIKSPKHSTSLSVVATSDGPPASIGPDNGGGQVQGNGGRTVESRKKTAATKRVITTLVAHHLAVKATHVAKKATKAVAARNGHVDLKNLPPPPPPPVIIDSDRVSGMTPMDIDFTPDELTALTVSPGNLRVNVRGTPNQGAVGSVVTTLTNFRGALTVGDGLGHLSRVQGALDVTNPTGPISSLIVDGSTEPGKQSATISPGVISGLAPAKITYPALDVTVIHLLGGTGGNTFHVKGTAPRVPVMIDGGSGANTLIGPNLKRTWNITAHDAGNVNNVTFQRVGNVTGGKRADTFALSDGATLSGGVDGGKGLNTLDMSAQNRDVVVNLAMGTATSIGGRVVNITSAIGGNASSILVGDGTTNSLQGGSGRNLLIGGGGSVQVTGGAGDNILIGGTTSYDLEPAALDALMQEFARSDEDFITRLAHLLSGDGKNNDTLLNSTTVPASATNNVLAGGPGNNWFFVPEVNDTIKSGTLRPGNVVTKL